jgi:Plasmid pRiA4b ORF-3-like protein
MKGEKMRTTKPDTTNSIYNLTVTLLYMKPAVWRRLHVPGNTTLADLHVILQVAMGWYNCHLYEFTYREATYGEPDPEEGWLDAVDDARRITLAKLLPAAGVSLRYRYDFGDNWEHQIKVNGIVPPSPGTHYPRCVAGKRACPPEDCGGPWGYGNLLDRLQQPDAAVHDRHRVDPDAFDLSEVNERLNPQFLAEMRRQIDPDLVQCAARDDCDFEQDLPLHGHMKRP